MLLRRAPVARLAAPVRASAHGAPPALAAALAAALRRRRCVCYIQMRDSIWDQSQAVCLCGVHAANIEPVSPIPNIDSSWGIYHTLRVEPNLMAELVFRYPGS